MKLLDFLRKIRNKRRFKSNSMHDRTLMIGAHSNCISDDKQNIVIGAHTEILGTLQSVGKGKINIGNYTTIRGNSFIGSVDEISIGNYCIISNNVKIYDNNNHPTTPSIRKQMCIDGFYGDAWRWTHAEYAPVIIDDNVWIGEHVTILKGVHIGQGSVIGCRSVVTKDVPPYSVVAGNPAKVVKEIENK